jgi:hypothetical protein
MNHKDLLKNLRLSYLKSLVFNVSLTRLIGCPTIFLNLITDPRKPASKRFLDGAKQCLVEN